MSKVCYFVILCVYILLLLYVWFYSIFVTRDFKIQWFPRFGRDDRVRERRSGFFVQKPHPGKLKPGGVVCCPCVVSVPAVRIPVGMNDHMTASAGVRVETEKVKFQEDGTRTMNGS